MYEIPEKSTGRVLARREFLGVGVCGAAALSVPPALS